MDEALDYDRIIADQERILNLRPLPTQEVNELNYCYAQTVADNLGQCLPLAIDCSCSLKNENSRSYMRHAVTVRLQLIHRAFREIVQVAGPLRSKPLSLDESFHVCRDLNFIYLNIRGVLDNLAYCFAYEKIRDSELVNDEHLKLLKIFPSEKAQKKAENLFEFNDYKFLKKIWENYQEWNTELSEKRNPAAHRFPLTIPSFMTTDEVEWARGEYKKNCNAMSEKDYDSINFSRCFDRGAFVPKFITDPHDYSKDNLLKDLYPTIAIDVSHLIIIHRKVIEHLHTDKS